jgi:hypothetical protein
MRYYMRRIRINQGGYTDQGQYFGLGAPLYEVSNDECVRHVRGHSRATAKENFREQYDRNAEFMR